VLSERMKNYFNGTVAYANIFSTRRHQIVLNDEGVCLSS
jgi:hypothetical protein